MNEERGSEASIMQCGTPRGDHAAWCDLQNDHGGNMHSGVLDGKRIWWDRKGRSVTFPRDTAPTFYGVAAGSTGRAAS